MLCGCMVCLYNITCVLVGYFRSEDRQRKGRQLAVLSDNVDKRYKCVSAMEPCINTDECQKRHIANSNGRQYNSTTSRMDKRITYGIHGIERIDASAVRIRRIPPIRHIAVECAKQLVPQSALHITFTCTQPYAHERQETTLIFFSFDFLLLSCWRCNALGQIE